MLNESGVSYEVNPHERKLTEDELMEVLQGVEILIAGTEPLSAAVLGAARDLKLISRVGVGLDNVNLRVTRSRGGTSQA